MLKPGAKNSEDWRWLVAKFERKIGYWCNKWLSLGGRYVLVNSVLQSLSVFWMSMERIPCFILTNLRRLSFNFLWSGQNVNHQFHLCSWEILSRRIRVGDWGLKNLTLFNTTLLANSFWRALTHDNIWHRIIVDKYLGNLPLLDWIRKPSHLQRRVSSIWKGLTLSSPMVFHWLRWRPGSGSDILIGRDKILGLEDRSILSTPLRSHLTSINILWLAQARDLIRVFPLPNKWLSSGHLNLSGEATTDWDTFSSALRSAGISLNSESDTIFWAGGDASGVLTVKKLYTALLQQLDFGIDNLWFHRLWKWLIPLKIKLFIWLSAKGKVLT
jgi:hypothetical protein